MLDVRNCALAISGHSTPPEEPALDKNATNSPASPRERRFSEPTPVVRTIALPADVGSRSISLQDMVATGVALRSRLDLKIDKNFVGWTPESFSVHSTTSSSINSLDASDSEVPQTEAGLLPSRVALVLSELQKELILLRNDLNLELWISRENVKHIGRLHQIRILSKNAEAERQGLVRAVLNERDTTDVRASPSLINFASTGLRW